MHAQAASPTNRFPVDTRLRPLTALRAARTLIATGDTRQVFILLRAMRGRSWVRNFHRFAQSDVGREVLRESRDLLPLLQDREGLRRLPDGSLGRAYLEFMESEDLSADALVMASQDWDNDPVPPDVQRSAPACASCTTSIMSSPAMAATRWANCAS
jgi:hypothetical protein